jgi:hypothetical protein
VTGASVTSPGSADKSMLPHVGLILYAIDKALGWVRYTISLQQSFSCVTRETCVRGRWISRFFNAISLPQSFSVAEEVGGVMAGWPGSPTLIAEDKPTLPPYNLVDNPFNRHSHGVSIEHYNGQLDRRFERWQAHHHPRSIGPGDWFVRRETERGGKGLGGSRRDPGRSLRCATCMVIHRVDTDGFVLG